MDELTFLIGAVLPASTEYAYMVFCLSEALNVCLDGILPTHEPVQKSSNGRFMRTVGITLKMLPFSQEFLILWQYYMLAPHDSLHLIT